MKNPGLLLIRVNSTHELFHTRTAPDILRKVFPDARLLTLATPQTETLALLRNDPRFDDVLVFPSDEAADKSPAALKRFLASHNIDVTVACYGTMREINYQRHVLSLLLCPGRKMLMDGGGRLFPLPSLRGLATIAPMAGRTVFAALAKRVTRLRHQSWWRMLAILNFSGKLKQGSGAIRRILWIRLDNIGDVVMAMPALRLLQANYPEATVDVLIQSCSKPIFSDLPDIGEIFVYNPPHMLTGAGKPSTRWEWLALARTLRRRHYDMVVETRGNAASRVLAYVSGAVWRVGPVRGPYEHPTEENFSGLMTLGVPLDYGSEHAVENSLRVVEKIGVAVSEPRFRFGLADGDDSAITALLAELGVTGDFAVLHGSTTDSMKQWPTERFAAVADHLVQVHGLDVLLTGSGEDAPVNEKVRSAAKNPERVHNVAGKVSLRNLPALYKNTRIMVTVDTGPMHIAAAVGTPIVALSLPWIAAMHYPFGQRDGVVTPFTGTVAEAAEQPYFSDWRGEFMGGISVEDVIEAVDVKLREAAGYHSQSADTEA